MTHDESSTARTPEQLVADNRLLVLELDRARALLVEEREQHATDLAEAADRLAAAVRRRKRVARERDRAAARLAESLYAESRAVRLTSRLVRRARRGRS